MPIRIYALAKDLKLDSKELVDLCAKAGISGKGSALASLDDDEVTKVKAYLSGPKKAAGRPADSTRAAATTDAAPQPYTREDYIPAGAGQKTKVKVLPAKKKAAPVSQPEETASPPQSPAAAETPAAAESSKTDEPTEAQAAEPTLADEPAKTEPAKTEPTKAEPAKAEFAKAEPEKAEFAKAEPEKAEPPEVPKAVEPSRPAQADKAAADDSPRRFAPKKGIPPAPGPYREKGVMERGPLAKDKTTGKRGGDRSKPRPKRGPTVKLADMPQAKQPAAPAKSSEPKPQKPEIRLPKDAIMGHKKGEKAPLEDLAKAARVEEKGAAAKPGAKTDKKAETPKKATPAGDAGAGKAGPRGRRDKAAGGGLTDMASARADRQKARKSRTRPRTGQDESRTPYRGRRQRTLTRRGTNTAAPRKGKVALELPCTVRSFSEAAGVPSAQVQRTLMQLGQMVTINAQVDPEYVELLAGELGVELEFKQPESLEDSLLVRMEEAEDDPALLQTRPPVITFLGHVDHGKTSLLDRIIGIDVVSGEAGGITQHIRAYKIEKDGRAIGFVDTPGHEAFTEMRARGATVTDIAVLVIAADDGVMPQTEEAISHAKAAGVPIVVALNKSDLPGTDYNRVLQQLAAADLLPSEWGGDVEVIRTSALTGEGIDDLLETILLTADMHDYRANPQRPAIGACLESEQQPGRGVVAKLIIQNGTLRVGDIVVCGAAYGRVKAMYDTLRPRIKLDEAGPSTPVNVTGLDSPPEAGDRFYVLEDIGQAREIAEQRLHRSRTQSLSGSTTRVSFEQFQELLQGGRLGDDQDVVHLNLIIRADTRGSIEAIQKELTKLEHPEVQIRILQATVGGVTAADVTLGHASHAVIIGFNVIPDEAARTLAEEHQVEIRRYDVIYKVSDDIKALLAGKLKPEERVVELGRALVKQVFPISRVGTVAGCYVAQGVIERGCRIRVNREGRTIGDYPLDTLRRERDDIKEVPRGMECGIKLAGFNDIKKDDILEAYKIEEVARTF